MYIYMYINMYIYTYIQIYIHTYTRVYMSATAQARHLTMPRSITSSSSSRKGTNPQKVSSIFFLIKHLNSKLVCVDFEHIDLKLKTKCLSVGQSPLATALIKS